MGNDDDEAEEENVEVEESPDVEESDTRAWRAERWKWFKDVKSAMFHANHALCGLCVRGRGQRVARGGPRCVICLDGDLHEMGIRRMVLKSDKEPSIRDSASESVLEAARIEGHA